MQKDKSKKFNLLFQTNLAYGAATLLFLDIYKNNTFNFSLTKKQKSNQKIISEIRKKLIGTRNSQKLFFEIFRKFLGQESLKSNHQPYENYVKIDLQIQSCFLNNVGHD